MDACRFSVTETCTRCRSVARNSTAFDTPTVPASTGGRTSTGTSGRPTAAAMNSGSIPGLTAMRSRSSTRVRFTTTVSWMNTS